SSRCGAAEHGGWHPQYRGGSALSADALCVQSTQARVLATAAGRCVPSRHVCRHVSRTSTLLCPLGVHGTFPAGVQHRDHATARGTAATTRRPPGLYCPPGLSPAATAGDQTLLRADPQGALA